MTSAPGSCWRISGRFVEIISLLTCEIVSTSMRCLPFINYFGRFIALPWDHTSELTSFCIFPTALDPKHKATSPLCLLLACTFSPYTLLLASVLLSSSSTNGDSILVLATWSKLDTLSPYLILLTRASSCRRAEIPFRKFFLFVSAFSCIRASSMVSQRPLHR